LRETQQIEKAQVSQKVVATSYGGLVGKFLDDTTETLPGYVPVVDETVSAAPTSSGSTSSGDSPSTAPAPQAGGGGAPTLQILGNNPAQLSVGDSYIDLGAVATDNVGHELGYTLYLDGTKVYEIQINTKAYGVHTIKYVTVDSAGNTTEATRTVVVGTPPPVVPDASSPPATASSSESSL